jgi:hypothetical protein
MAGMAKPPEPSQAEIQELENLIRQRREDGC